MQKKSVFYGLFCLLLALSLVLPGLTVSAAEDGTVTVKVRLAGLDGVYYEEVLEVGATAYVNASGDEVAMETATPMGALVELLEEKKVSYVANTTAYGVYVTRIGADQEKDINANTGWTAYVNGSYPNVAADLHELQDGDEVVWAFYDYTQTLYPNVDVGGVTHVKVGDELKVKVTAEQTTYDEEWNPTVTTVPVEAATVRVQGRDAEIVTDANGEAVIPVEQAGVLRFQLEKVEAETGLPLVVRSAWQQVVAAQASVAFDDLTGYEWASAAVAELADRGAVVGNGQGQFLPGRAVTRAELAKMLVLGANLPLAGAESFTDVAESHALRPYIQAAAASGLMIGDAEGTFRPDAPVSRQELAVVLVRLEDPEAIPEIMPVFGDFDQVKPYARDSVVAAFALHLMVGDPSGVFRPGDAALRAEVAQALVNSWSN